MIVHDFPQYSLEWFKTRCGLPSASRAGEILTPTGRKPAGQKKYMAELLADALKLNEEEDIQTEHMARGLELEEDARLWYEMETNSDVGQVGLILNDDGTACCSPDGVKWEHEHDHVIVGGLEIKCPMAKTHLMYLLEGVLPAAYRPQVHMSLAITGLQAWTFLSYFPGLDPFVIEVEWDDYTQKMYDELTNFTNELGQLKDKYL
jgi:hypothetical protein